MCAGCPGGRAVSRVAAYVNTKGIKGEVARLLQQTAGGRATVSAFGDQWVLRSPTGKQQVLADLEHLAAVLVSGRTIDGDRLHHLAGTPAAHRAGGTTQAPPPDVRFEQIRSLPLASDLPERTAAEFTLALLGHASRRHSA